MIPSELLRRIRRIEITTSRVVDEILAGQYHSAFKGRGMEFEEVRQYQIGDDVRTIDWNVTARAGEPYIKLFREEREMSVNLLVDLSASQAVGSEGQLKRELVAQVGATLAFSAIDNSDKVGFTGFTDQIEKVVPPRKGKRHVLRVIRELLFCEPISTGTDIRQAIDHFNKMQKRRSVVFLISDFLDHGYEKALRVAARRHDIIPIIVSDPREYDLPNVGLIELRDAETGQQVLIDTASRRNRQAYREKMFAFAERRRQLFRRFKIEAVTLTTGEDFVEPLAQYFRKREARLAR